MDQLPWQLYKMSLHSLGETHADTASQLSAPEVDQSRPGCIYNHHWDCREEGVDQIVQRSTATAFSISFKTWGLPSGTVLILPKT